jgi:hypothetical protein
MKHIIVMIVFVTMFLSSITVAGDLTRTHSCSSLYDARALAEAFVKDPGMPYYEKAQRMIRNGRCKTVLIPNHTPHNVHPVDIVRGRGYDIHIHTVGGNDGIPWFALKISGSISTDL